jgi:cell wall assembly regulator SMI1
MTEPDSVRRSWRRIAAWIQENTDFNLEFDSGVTQNAISEFEDYLGRKLPSDFVKSLLTHASAKKIIPCPYGLKAYSLLSIDEMIEVWLEMNDRYDRLFKSFDHGRVKSSPGVIQQWWAPYWLPFATEGSGDFMCIDLCPTYPGILGQVLWVPHDSPKRLILADSTFDFLSELANNFELGVYKIRKDDGVVKTPKASFPSRSLRRKKRKSNT